MDRLNSFVAALQVLAQQPDSGNRQYLAEKQINEYVQAEVAALKAALERLAKAIDARAKQGGDWSMIRTYVQTCLEGA
jgi:hypothetical protein